MKLAFLVAVCAAAAVLAVEGFSGIGFSDAERGALIGGATAAVMATRRRRAAEPAPPSGSPAEGFPSAR